MAGTRVTAEDVARRAGVSRATVSYVLNNHPHQSIPDATRQKVLDAASALDYTPLASARILSRGRSDVVVMLIPDWPLGPVIPQVMESVGDGLAPFGFELFLHRCRQGRPVKDLWNAITPAAVIRIGSLGAEDDASLRRSQIGYLLELANTELERGLVLFPGVQTGKIQAEHLAHRGHRRLGYAWPGDSRLEGFATARLEGVRKACAHLKLDEPDVQVVSFDPQETADALKAWRVNGVTGICAFNDELAIGLVHASRRQGVNVPTDLAIVGVDNLPWGALTEPALTTVAPDAQQIGQAITDLVMAGLGGSTAEPAHLRGSFINLIVRDSA